MKKNVHNISFIRLKRTLLKYIVFKHNSTSLNKNTKISVTYITQIRYFFIFLNDTLINLLFLS